MNRCLRSRISVVFYSLLALSVAGEVNGEENNKPEAARCRNDDKARTNDVQPLLVKFCGECHNAQTHEGDVRFDALRGSEKEPFLNVLNKAESQLFFGMMPPVEAPQPSAEERRRLLAWVQSELRASNASGLDQKARSPEAGNWVEHTKLFDGSVQEKAYSPARRWLVSPQIFLQRAFDVFALEQRQRDGNRNGLRGLTSPVTLPEHSGVRDYDLAVLSGGHLLTMLGNAEWMSKKQIRAARVKSGEIKADEFENKADRFSPVTPPTFEKIILKKSFPTSVEIESAIITQFERVLRRAPSGDELRRYTDLTSEAIQIAGNTEGLRQMLQAVLLESVAADKNDQTRYALERKLLEFTAGSESSLAADLNGSERAKVASYADAVNEIRRRNENVDGMADAIRKNLPQLDPRYLADSLTTIDRQCGHVEILLSTLIVGMTNVVAFTVDELGTQYTGLPGVENDPVNLHDVGHGKGFGKLTPLEIREAVRTQHMKLVDTIISRLKAVPEADGNMFDNTLLFYFADNGETHHSNGHEWPFMVFSGRNAKLDIAGRYIRLPKHGEAGHKTLGNWYTTILNAYGNPIQHFGDLDMALESKKLPQVGPITQFTA